MSEALASLMARLARTAPGLRAEVDPGARARGLYSYDASNYRVPPMAVVFPRRTDDVVAVVQAGREAGVALTARGGGTSMAGNAIGPSRVPHGRHSTEVRGALDLCLSCKACSADCPVGVDMATFKAEFLHHHYKGRLRPRSHYSLGWLPLTSALPGYAARPLNALLRGPWALSSPVWAVRPPSAASPPSLPRVPCARSCWKRRPTYPRGPCSSSTVSPATPPR
ncbi:UNVERIFIED_CONTAM: ferredoxin [Streptomyces canus]